MGEPNGLDGSGRPWTSAARFPNSVCCSWAPEALRAAPMARRRVPARQVACTVAESSHDTEGRHDQDESQHARRPPSAGVFDFVSDLSNRPQWDREMISAQWTSEGPVRAGSTYGVVTGFLGRKIQIAVEITGWDPPRSWGVRSRSGPFPVEATTTCEADGNGTRVTETSQATVTRRSMPCGWCWKGSSRQHGIEPARGGRRSGRAILAQSPSRSSTTGAIASSAASVGGQSSTSTWV